MNQYCIENEKTIPSWDEGIPLGNGDIGAIIWSKSNALRFSIDKGDIWDCSYQPASQKDFTYKRLCQLVEEKKNTEIWRIYDKNGYTKSSPTKLPVGKIILDLGVDANVVSSLDLSKAHATLKAGAVTLHTFIDATERIGYIQATSPAIKISLDNPKFGKENPSIFQKLFKNKGFTYSLKSLHYKAPIIKSETIMQKDKKIELLYYIQQVNASFSYSMIVAIHRTEKDCLITYTVASDNDGKDFIEIGKRNVIAAIAKGYESAFQNHDAWWTQYWAQSSITIPDKIIEKYWYVGNYLLASCSRKGFYPMPLQGLWTADSNQLPPWKGDYHHDLNTQLCYLSYGKSNHMDEGACFIDYLMKMAPVAERFAKSYYGTNGLCLPAVMDINGGALGGWAMYSLSPTNQLWLCDIIFKHYEFGRDKNFLSEKAYPYVEKSMQNIIELFVEKDGKYYLPWSSSSEIHENSIKAFLLPNSNYDLCLIMAALKKLVQYAEQVGKPENINKYNAILSKLDNIAVDSDNVLMINRKERLDISHRHHSHAMAIYPLRLLSYDVEQEKKIIDATIADMEKLGTKNWCGYSFAWLTQFYCVQRNGAKASETLNIFWNYFCLKNGFHVNGDYTKQGYSDSTYRPFTLEGTFCAVGATQEMLLFGENGVIEPLRAVPEDWKNVEFENLRCSGGVLVSLKYANGEMKYIKLQASVPTTITLVHKFAGSFQTSKEVSEVEGGIRVELAPNEVFEISASI